MPGRRWEGKLTLSEDGRRWRKHWGEALTLPSGPPCSWLRLTHRYVRGAVVEGPWSALEASEGVAHGVSEGDRAGVSFTSRARVQGFNPDGESDFSDEEEEDDEGSWNEMWEGPAAWDGSDGDEEFHHESSDSDSDMMSVTQSESEDGSEDEGEEEGGGGGYDQGDVDLEDLD